MSEFARYQVPLKVKTFRSSTLADREADPTLTVWSKVHAGYLSGDIIVEVDLKGLARDLGEKALRAAGKKAREAGGLVLVRAINVKRKALPTIDTSPRCDCCREPFALADSDASDPGRYCSAACERGELA